MSKEHVRAIYLFGKALSRFRLLVQPRNMNERELNGVSKGVAVAKMISGLFIIRPISSGGYGIGRSGRDGSQEFHEGKVKAFGLLYV